MGQLQVRQGHKSLVYHPHNSLAPWYITWGPWIDVPSPGWLFGFILPQPGLVYEFRYAPEGEQ